MTQQPDNTSRQRLPASTVRYHQVQTQDHDDNSISIAPSTQSPPTPSSVNGEAKESGKRVKARPKWQAIKKAWKPVKKRWKKLSAAYDRAIVDHWTFEVLAILVCISTLVAILAVLFVFHDKPSPHIMAGVPLNTVISILATLSRASTVLVAAAVIAQQKWLRYKKKIHSLIDVLTYDDATRGPLGSFYLLITWRLSFFTALAALVAVLALGFEPFVQQSVRYPLRDYPDSNSALPLIQAVQNLSVDNFYANPNLTISFAAVITQALYAESVQVLQPNCPSAACTWPLYKSVAFCSSCEDATNNATITLQKCSKGYCSYDDHPEVPLHDDPVLGTHNNEYYLDNLEGSNLDLGYNAGAVMAMPRNTTYYVCLDTGLCTTFVLYANYTLPVGLGSGSGTYSTVLSYPTTAAWDLGSYADYYLEYPVKAFGWVNVGPSADGKRLVIRSAKRCQMSLCAQQYSGTFRNGTLVSHVTDMTWGKFTQAGYGDWAANLTGSSFTNKLELSYITSSLSLLSGQVINTTRSFDSSTKPEIHNPAADSVQFMSNFEKSCANIAQGLTNFIQQYGDSVIPGQGYMSTSVVEVRWAWLAFPISLVAIVMITLLVTIIQTYYYKLPMWKSSPFPFFYNYHDPNPYGDGEDRPEDQELREQGEDTAFNPQVIKTSAHQDLARKTRLQLRSIAGSWILEKKA